LEIGKLTGEKGTVSDVAAEKQMQRTRLYLTYLYTVGLICFAFTVCVQISPEWVGLERQGDFLPVVVLFCFACGTRFLGFQAPLKQVTLGLEMPVFMTAVLTIGTVNGGLIVFLSMFVYGLMRKGKYRNRGWREHFGVILYISAMTATVIVGVALLLRADMRSPTLFDGWLGYWFVPVLGLCFIGLQYVLACVPYVLRGITWRTIWRDVIIPCLSAELALIPLAILAILVFNRMNLVPFALLAGSYLFVNYVVKRLSEASSALTRRVSELEGLNRLGQAVCATLDTPELVGLVARETLEVFPRADAVCIDWLGAGQSTKSRLEIYDRHGEAPDDFPRREALGITARTRKVNQPIQHVSSVGSWLAVPVTVQGQVVGALALWAEIDHAFSDYDVTYLTTIASQASVAFENARLYELATVDSLTGLYIRRYFNARLAEEFERSRRYGGAFTLIMIDVDWLKSINDTYGHPTGDRVLCQVARIIREETRLVDIPARLGGDEFSVLLPNLAAENGLMVAERMRTAIASLPIIEGTRQLKVTVSMGVVSYPEMTAGSPEQMVSAADKALYKAKMTPVRNQVVLWQPE